MANKTLAAGGAATHIGGNMMNTKLSQLWGIIRYEVRLQWVRRSLVIVGVCFALVVLMFLGLSTSTADREGLNSTAATFGLLLSVAPASLLLVLLALPPVVAETIARDRPYGIDELRDTLPLTPGVYLLGKVLGVWVCVIIMIVAVVALLWIAGQFVLGPIDLVPFARLWLTVIIPAALFVSALSVLLASRQTSRRRATLIGSLIAIYCLLTIPFIESNAYGWGESALPSAWLTLALSNAFHTVANSTELPAALLQFALIPEAFLWQTAVAMSVQLLFIWLIVWGWWQWRQA